MSSEVVSEIKQVILKMTNKKLSILYYGEKAKLKMNCMLGQRDANMKMYF